MPSHYPVTVVIPSMRGWPRMSISVDSVLPQVRQIGGQLVIADGSEHGPPRQIADEPNVTWLSMPRATVFELRQAAYRRAEAPLIASTEDHCQVADDWLLTVLRAHEEAPDAAMIFGAVENGTDQHTVDWALYCAGYAPLSPPLNSDVTTNPGHANTSWKRWAFDLVPSGGQNVMEFRFNAALREAGARIVADDRMRVRHFQCDPIGPTAALFFHNGRAIAGIRRDSMEPADWIRLLAPQLVAGVRTARAMRSAWRKPIRGAALRSAPWIALLHMAHLLGEGVGYLGGSGDSGRHLH